MILRPLALLAAAGAALAAPPGADEARVVERVVAVIRSPASPQARVVTLTRLQEETRVALIARGGTLAAVAPLDAEALRAGLDWLVDQILLADEAARLQLLNIDPADVAAELARFRARFARPADYTAFLARQGATEEELAAMLRRTLGVRRYVEGRVGRAGDASDAEVKALVTDLRARAEVRILYDFGGRG
jgi:hypothetical protein